MPILTGVCVAASVAPSRGTGQAQPPALSEARLQGVVVDETTRQPVDSATVSLAGHGEAVITGRWGDFAFPDAPLGTVAVQVSAPGHPSVVQDVTVVGDRIAFVQIVLPSVAAVLSELLVRGSQAGPPTEAARTAADLLALEVSRMRPSSGEVGKSDYQVRLRSANTFQGVGEPLILIDGVVMSRAQNAFDALEQIPASDVDEIELLKGPAAAFLYPYAANGVVHVKTKKGRRGR